MKDYEIIKTYGDIALVYVLENGERVPALNSKGQTSNDTKWNLIYEKRIVKLSKLKK